MGQLESEDISSVAFADVLAALRTLGGVAHIDVISRQILQAKRLTPSARTVMHSQVRDLLAEQERVSAAAVQRVFGAGSNRWRLN